MESALPTLNEDVYENMSYDERRNFNLARNREVMNLLFAGGSALLPKDNEDVKASPSTPLKLVDAVPNEADPETMLKDIAMDNIYCRDKELLRILQFLDKSMFPTQPMYVYGPVASGKSHLCESALRNVTSSAHMIVSCAAATSCKRFLQGLWLDALASISNFNMSQLNISSSFEEDIKIKNVSTFSELVDRMASLLYCQAHILKQVHTMKLPGLLMIIDHIDRADVLEEGLSRRLLCMNELCHPMIKILAIGRSLPHSLAADTFLLQLRPYTDEQLISILCKKHEHLHRSDISTYSKPDFKIMCEQALSHFTLITRRVDEIWTMMQALYDRRSNLSRVVEIPEKNCEIDGSSGVKSVSSLSGSKRPLEADVKTLVQLPAIHMVAASRKNNAITATAQFSTPSPLPIDLDSLHGNHWCVHLPLRVKALILSAFLASRNPPATDRSTFGHATKGRRKKTKGDSSKMSVGSQPQSFGTERLLSIFGQVFPSISGAVEDMSINKYRKLRNVSSAGEVDKRVSIFSDSHKSKNANTHNEAILYSMINTLVKKRILISYAVSAAGTKAVKTSDSNNHLLYLCALPMNRADELAQSVGFPLKDYLSY